jgi:hypothetical protein
MEGRRQKKKALAVNYPLAVLGKRKVEMGLRKLNGAWKE